MIVAGSASPLLLASAGGYNLTKSLRFRRSASATLSRTPSTSGNRKTWTMSFWYKRGIFGVTNNMLGCYAGVNDDANNFEFRFNTSDQLQVVLWNYLSTTSAVFRDPSAWYHIVLALDTTQAGTSSGSKIKVYVNGVLQSWGSDSISSSISQNDDLIWNSATTQFIGRWQASDGGAYFQDCYMAEVNFINGQALTPSSFGETSTSTGVWIPKKYTGTYGTNGFYLPFTNTTSTSTLGNDFSGNSNTWTVNNISLTSGSTYDSMTDVPTLTSATTANYAVLNPLRSYSANTISNANLNVLFTDAISSRTTFSTFGVTSGKWYFEMTVTATGGGYYPGLGVNTDLSFAPSGQSGDTASGYMYLSTGQKFSATLSAYGSSYTTNDVIGVALDMDGGTITFYKNNTSQGQAFSGITGTAVPCFIGNASSSCAVNFGQRPFTYTPPTGFVALNTYNLPTPTIGATASTTANKYFTANLYTGNAGSNTISGVGFQPDFIWAKSRSNGAAYHGLWDVVRGSNNLLYSNGTDAEANVSNLNMSPNADGFSINGGNSSFNLNTSSQVAWNWKANGTGVTNTAGSITSTVSANTTAGFSIVAYTGNGTNGATVGHGLGAKPFLIIEKGRTSTYNWSVQGCGELWTPATSTLFLNTTNALNSGGAVAAPTSTVFTPSVVAYANESGVTNIAYCFAPVAGYSAFGKYTGNGSTDGPFIFTGFRPKFVMFKGSSIASNWCMLDSSRNTYNLTDATLQANSSAAELTNLSDVDFLSNGIKIRDVVTNDTNVSGQTYIYMAFAEVPLKFSNAR